MYGYGAPTTGGYSVPTGGYGAPVPTGGYSMPGAPAGMPTPMPGYGGMPGYGAPPGYGMPGFAPSNPVAWSLFSAVDADRSGSISQKELQVALSNGGWTPFSAKTTNMLIKMFDTDRSGTLNYSEFERLLGMMDNWRRMFEGADKDRSGRLSAPEVKTCVRSLGFSCPDPVLNAIYNAYDDDRSGNLAFDEFVRLLAELTCLTNAFRRFDPAGSGSATMNYNQFLEVVFSSRS